LTDSEFNAICDCVTLRRLDEGSEPHDADPLLWSIDRSHGRMWREGERPRKFHVDRGDSTAKCSSRILLNSIDATRPTGFGGAISADAPAGRVSEIEAEMPELICRRCVPKPHDVGHPLLRMGTADPGVYECGEECEGDAHFHDPETATYPKPTDYEEADRG
jgi:hypothetical protein